MAPPASNTYCVQCLAFAPPMLKVWMGCWGGDMGQTGAERTRVLAQNLMELLTSYEEELMTLEREVPAIGQLRRAVGITIAEACFVITDQGLAQAEWVPPADGSSRHAGQ